MIDFWRQLPFSRHSLFFPTVAFSLSWLVWLCFNVVIEFWQQFLVVCIDYLLNVIHATVADFNCVLIKYFAEWAAFGEAFVDKLQESLADVGFDAFAEWRVKPYDVIAGSVLSPLISWWLVFKFEVVSSFLYCFLVGWCGGVKRFLVWW